MNALRARRRPPVASRKVADDSGPAFATAMEIAIALEITPRAVRRRAGVERWRSEHRTCKGGVEIVFPIDRLPRYVVRALSGVSSDSAEAVSVRALPGELASAVFRDGVPPRLGARAIATFLWMDARRVQQRAKIEGWPFVVSREAGGARGRHLFETAKLPADVQEVIAALVAGNSAARGSRPRSGRVDPKIIEAWYRYDSSAASEKFRRIARMRVDVVREVEGLVRDGLSNAEACRVVALGSQHSPEAIRQWRSACRGADPRDWVALVAPRWKPRKAYAHVPAEAWEMFKADYVANERVSCRASYERLKERAGSEGWKVPSLRTLQRRVSGELSRLDQRPAGWRRG